MKKITLGYQISLFEIIKKIAFLKKSMFWTLWGFDAFLKSNSEFDLNSIGDSIESSNLGYSIEEEVLINLAKDVMQLHTLLLTGNLSKRDLKEYSDDEYWYQNNSIVIEVVDACANWEISSNDTELILAISKLNKA